MAWGAGPRAVQFLILGAKARAALHGSYMVRLEDIHEVAVPVLTHRVITTFAAQAEGLDAKQIVRRLIGGGVGAAQPARAAYHKGWGAGYGKAAGLTRDGL